MEHYEKGCEYYLEDDFEAARDSFLAALESNPKSTKVLLKLAGSHYQLKAYPKMVEIAKQVVDLEKGNVAGYQKLALGYLSMEDYKQALLAVTSGLQLDKNHKLLKQYYETCLEHVEEEESHTDAEYEVTEMEVKPEVKVRWDWFQSGQEVTLNYFQKNLKEDEVEVHVEERKVTVSIRVNEEDTFTHEVHLLAGVQTEGYKVVVKKVKVEIILKKVEAGMWSGLEKVGDIEMRGLVMPVSTMGMNKHSYPTSNPKKVNWDQIDKEVPEEELEGEAALTKVFQDIYGNGSDEQKRAMMKSFVESGGTVLSTNWDEVGSKRVEVSPPKGMEAKEWSQQE